MLNDTKKSVFAMETARLLLTVLNNSVTRRVANRWMYIIRHRGDCDLEPHISLVALIVIRVTSIFTNIERSSLLQVLYNLVNYHILCEIRFESAHL